MSVTGVLDLEREIQAVPPLTALTGVLDLERQISPYRPSIGGFLTLQRVLGVDLTYVEVVITGAPTGLVGTITVAIQTLDGSVYTYFPTTQGIEEIPEDTGRYVATVPKPDTGQYFVVWDTGSGNTNYGTLNVIFDPSQPAYIKILDVPRPYALGSLAHTRAEYRDPFTDDLVDPTTVTFQVQTPDGNTTTYTYGTDTEVAREREGVYTTEIDITDPGTWTYRWSSSATFQGAHENRFHIIESVF